MKTALRRKIARFYAALDRDPSKWPVAPGAREYMVDCEVCGSRMPLKIIGPHTRRHLRHGEMGRAA